MRFFSKIKPLMKSEHFKTCVEGVVAIATILATVAALVAVSIANDTLKEMQIERDHSYQPCLVFEDKQIDITWGDQDVLAQKNPMVSPDETENPLGIKIKALNIGVGVAKNIKILFKMDTLDKWITLLQKERPEKEYSHRISSEGLEVILDGKKTTYSTHVQSTKLYLLPNAEESFEVILPIEYSSVIHKIYEEFQIGRDDLAPIETVIEFEDIQGKSYSQDVSFAVQTLFLTSDGKENGYASYRIIMK